MKRSIKDLKKIVTDRTRLISSTGRPIIIRRFPNNIIKIHNKSVSWKSLLDLLANGDYQLDIDQAQPVTTKNWGGFRFPGPGRTLGRNKVRDKKKPLTLSVKESVLKKMSDILEAKNISKNDFFEAVINHTHDTLNKE